MTDKNRGGGNHPPFGMRGLTARAMLKYWRTFKRLGLMGSKHEGKKYLKHIGFLEHFSVQDCAKTHLQQSRISKIFPGEKPPDPHSKGRPGAGVGVVGGGWGAGGGGRGAGRECTVPPAQSYFYHCCGGRMVKAAASLSRDLGFKPGQAGPPSLKWGAIEFQQRATSVGCCAKSNRVA